MNIEYWHWYLIASLLLILEIFVSGFVLAWLGISGLVVGTVLLVFEQISIAVQLFLWAIFSGISVFCWFKFIKPVSKNKTTAGMAREAILDSVGKVVRLPTDSERGIVRFPQPLMGSRDWSFVCNQETEIGDRVSVSDILGNAFIVKKV